MNNKRLIGAVGIVINFIPPILTLFGIWQKMFFGSLISFIVRLLPSIPFPFLENKFVLATWINAFVIIGLFFLIQYLYFNNIKIRSHRDIEKLPRRYYFLFWICLVLSLLLNFIIIVSLMNMWAIIFTSNIVKLIILMIVYLILNTITLLSLQILLPPPKFKYIPMLYKYLKLT